jgi:hypothetical protein
MLGSVDGFFLRKISTCSFVTVKGSWKLGIEKGTAFPSL